MEVMKAREFSRRVLVVDDEPVVRSGIAQALERLGFEVRLAAHGGEGLKIMAAWSAGIVLLDVRLPDMDGLEVLKRLSRDYPETVVIMITGHPNIEGAVESIKHGALDYLVKPFHLHHLEALVAKAQETMHHRIPAVPPPAEDRAGQGALFEVNPKNRTFSFGLSMDWPIFTGFRTSLQVAQADVDARNANEQLRAARLQLQREVRSALIDVQNAYRALQLAQQSAGFSRERLSLAQERYAIADIQFSNLQLIINQASQAERQLVDAQFGFATAMVTLQEAVGTEVGP